MNQVSVRERSEKGGGSAVCSEWLKGRIEKAILGVGKEKREEGGGRGEGTEV